MTATLSQAGFVEAAQTAAEPQTHALFMGLDLSVEHGKSFHRVKDVSGDEFVITSNGAPVFLPVNRASRNLKIVHSLKLTSASALITNLTSERAYTAGNNPKMQRLKEMNRVSAGLEDAASLAVDQYAALQQGSSGIYAGIGDVSGSGGVAQAAAQARTDAASEKAMMAFEAANGLATSNLTSSSFYDGRLQDDLARELYDAIDIKFEIAAEAPLNNPYVVLVARFREPKAPASTARNWIYAKSLDPIDSRPVKMHVMKGGFPPGYVLEDFKVHLYNRGEEVATNVASKRVPLTREEAFEYVKVQYISSHKGATLPATPAMGKLPPDLNTRLNSGQLNQTYYVKVSKEGVADAAYLDESCSQKIEDPYLEGVISSIRFKPALEKGKPVDAVAPLKLAGLSL
jgi:hypothetical protein